MAAGGIADGRGMAAALPFLDYFEAAHNLDALRALAGKLSL